MDHPQPTAPPDKAQHTLNYKKTNGRLTVHLSSTAPPGLVARLKAMGFQPQFGKHHWAAPFEPDRATLLQALQQAMTDGGTLPDLPLKNHHPATPVSITNRKFSVVELTVNGSNDPPLKEHYLVFDPSKTVAEGIGELFAQQQYGQDLAGVKAYPRTMKALARELLKKGKVLPVSQSESEADSPITKTDKEVKEKESPLKKTPDTPPPATPPKAAPAATEKNSDYKALLKSIRQEKASLKEMLDKEQAARIYRKLNELIPNLVPLASKGHEFGMAHPEGETTLYFEYLGQPDKHRHVVWLSHYLPERSGGVLPNPTIEVRLDAKARTAEVLSLQHPGGYRLVYINDHGRELVNPKERKYLNAFLDEWLTQLLQAGYRVDLSKKQAAPGEDWQRPDAPAADSTWQKSPLQRMKDIRQRVEQVAAAQEKQDSQAAATKEMNRLVRKVRDMEKALLNPEIFPDEE